VHLVGFYYKNNSLLSIKKPAIHPYTQKGE